MLHDQLQEILRLHELWMQDDDEGRRIELLPGTDLNEADLAGVDLLEASLSGVKLRGANLQRTCLSGVDLSEADLTGADLTGADMHGVDFCKADLRGAKFTHEIRNAGGLLEVLCDDDQLPWLIGHEYFSRRC